MLIAQMQTQTKIQVLLLPSSLFLHQHHSLLLFSQTQPFLKINTTSFSSFRLRVSNNRGTSTKISSVTKEDSFNEVDQQQQRLQQPRRAYPFHEIEPRWQRYGEDTFRTPDEIDTSKPKFYILDMFPYPSSSKVRISLLHFGILVRAAMANKSKEKTLSVYLYIPNIVGYIRVLMNCVAFARCFDDKKLFSVLYFISFVCDGLDGWLARKFNQVSTFGAVLDMVTDRVSTACLLVILSQIYSPGLVFLSLLSLDIASHWLQMYSTFLSGKASHKDVKDSTNWLFKAYYGNRFFMAYCCVASEVLYIILFLLADNKSESVIDVLMNAMKHSALSIPVLLALFGWAIKQTINVIQMKTAADVCVLYDINRRQRS